MYLLDSDVFINAKNRHYGFDIVPAFWEWLDQAHAEQRVFTVTACAIEVMDVADELADWMSPRRATMALAPVADDATALQTVSEWAIGQPQYTQGAVAQFLSVGDYFLVAQGLSLGFTVVTHEEPAPLAQKTVKIPDACRGVGVTYMSPFQMLRAEGARFRL